MNKSTCKTKGIHTISICNCRSSWAETLQELIENVRFKRQRAIVLGTGTRELFKDLWEEYNCYLKQLHRYYLTQQYQIENLTTTVGRSVLAQRLGGDTTYTGSIAYTALGTDNTAPAVGNTTLGTETYRKAVSSGIDSNNIAYIETFYTAAEVNGTFEEYGNFIDGSAAADSGELFNRFTQTVVKSVTESLNVRSTVTFSDA